MDNSQHIYFWKDKWIGELSLSHLFPVLFQICANPDLTVQDAWVHGDCVVTFVVALGTGKLQQWQLSAFIKASAPRQGDIDILIWRWNSNGNSTVQSLYHFLTFKGTKQLKKLNISFGWLEETKYLQGSSFKGAG
jgi:hypothetical protein